MVENLRSVTNWQTLGTHILPPDHVEEIQIIYENHKHDVLACQRDLFREYLKVGDRSWNTVIQALIKTGYKNLAKDIKQKRNL